MNFSHIFIHIKKKDENNNGQRIVVQQTLVPPAPPNIDQVPDQESKAEPMTGIKSTTGIITPKIEPLPYYPQPVGSAPPHVIKEIKPAVSFPRKFD